MLAMSAALRRICTPKPSSGKLEVGNDIYKQWKQGGAQRKCLLDVLIKANGDKDIFRGLSKKQIFKMIIYVGFTISFWEVYTSDWVP